MVDPVIDIDKYLDSLTLEELRAFAKIGISVSVQTLTVAVRSITKFCSSSDKYNFKKDSLGSS